VVVLCHKYTDICLGGDTRNPEGTVKILVEKAALQGTFLEAANYYVINVSASFVISDSYYFIVATYQS